MTTQDWSSLATTLSDTLHLSSAPLAITFSDAPLDGVPMFDEPKADARETLSEFFSQTDGAFSLRKKNNTRPELSASIAAIYANPCIPVDVYNALADAVNDLGGEYLSKVAHTAPYLEQSLAYYAQVKGGACQ